MVKTMSSVGGLLLLPSSNADNTSIDVRYEQHETGACFMSEVFLNTQPSGKQAATMSLNERNCYF